MHPAQQHPSDQPCSEPFWQAMQYLSGELSAEEAAAFESSLANDLAAAEALSRAVLLQDSLAACAADAPAAALISPAANLPLAARNRPAQGWRRPVVRRMVYGTAATLSAAVLFAVGWFGRGALGLRSPAGSALTTATGAPEAAPAGRDLRMDPLLSAWILLADDEPLPVEEFPFDLGVDPPAELAETSERGVPGWMIAALLTSADPASSPETLPAAPDPELEEL